MRKKIGKRFETRQQILDAIDLARKKAVTLVSQAEVLEDDAKKILKSGKGSAWSREQFVFMRVQADKLRHEAHLLTNNKLKKLKNKLSEFDTPQLKSIDNGDPSIPVR